jgi:hypothetical protein
MPVLVVPELHRTSPLGHTLPRTSILGTQFCHSLLFPYHFDIRCLVILTFFGVPFLALSLQLCLVFEVFKAELSVYSLVQIVRNIMR